MKQRKHIPKDISLEHVVCAYIELYNETGNRDIFEVSECRKLKPSPYEHIFCGKFFSNHFYLLIYMRKFVRILCDKRIYWKTGAPCRFYLAKKECRMRKFVRVLDPSQKICHTLRGWQWLLRFCFHCSQSFLAHRQTSFQHGFCCLYTQANILVTENLPEKICSSRLGLIWVMIRNVLNWWTSLCRFPRHNLKKYAFLLRQGRTAKICYNLWRNIKQSNKLTHGN